MPAWRNLRLIFLREVRDQLRDRRTLFMIAVLPLLLYPALGIGMVQLTVLFAEQPRTVVLLGEKYLPLPPLVYDSQFVAAWFPNKDLDARKLELISDGLVDETPLDKLPPRTRNLLQDARLIRDKLAEEKRLQQTQEEARDAGNAREAVRLGQQVRALQQELGHFFASSGMQVLVIVPENFAEHVAKTNRQIAAHKSPDEADRPRPIIVHNDADEKSVIAYSRVLQALKSWEDKILQERLKLANLPENFDSPIDLKSENLALDTQIAANIWSKLFPALLVIMSVTGAFYPAIDLCAGEKERGTMETLLICPATRTEIVLGKFLTVMAFSICTAVLNLLSMGMTGRHMATMISHGQAHASELSLPSPISLVWVVVLLIPLAALFSALCLALATFARSSKEGQYYLTPLLMVTLGLTVFCLSPGVEITPFYSVMPVAGVALLLKALLLSPISVGPGLYWYAVPVLVTTVIYSGLALWWAIDQFQREEVLFREAERFELGLWIRHLLRDKEDTPSFAEAAFCFVIVMLLQFAALKALAQASLGAGQPMDLSGTLRIMLIQQLAIVASPALFMAVMLTTKPWKTLRLTWPGWPCLLLAPVLAVACHPLSVELAQSLSWFFPPLPDSIRELMARIFDPAQKISLGYILVAFAVAPAICEEITFRGFILSGFHRHGRTGLAIALSSVAFGVMHMIPQQVFNAALLGLVLGFLAIRSGSLFPPVLFHLVFNSLAVFHGRLTGEWKDHPPAPFVSALKDGEVHYTWLTLSIAAAILLAGLYCLRPAPRSHDADENR